jgi:hypothetical protein
MCNIRHYFALSGLLRRGLLLPRAALRFTLGYQISAFQAFGGLFHDTNKLVEKYFIFIVDNYMIIVDNYMKIIKENRL